MNEQLPSLTYKGVEITFNELYERWEFTLDGRERFSQKLSAAKAVIDAPSKEKKKPFKQIEAYWEGYYRGYQKVKVTSLAEGSSANSAHFWISYTDISNRTSRSKIERRTLFAVNDKNDALIAEIKRLKDEVKKINDQIDQASAKLTPIPLPADL